MLDQKLWRALPDRHTMRLEGGGLRISNIPGLSQYLASGQISLAAAAAGVSAAGAGALGIASGNSYSVRVARDRLLVVSSHEKLLTPGWNDQGYAVTDMSAALEVFEFDGPLCSEIVKRATTLPLSGESPCAALAFAGISACLYCYRSDQVLRLHIDRALSAYVWEWLETMLGLTRSDESQLSGAAGR